MCGRAAGLAPAALPGARVPHGGRLGGAATAAPPPRGTTAGRMRDRHRNQREGGGCKVGLLVYIYIYIYDGAHTGPRWAARRRQEPAPAAGGARKPRARRPEAPDTKPYGHRCAAVRHAPSSADRAAGPRGTRIREDSPEHPAWRADGWRPGGATQWRTPQGGAVTSPRRRVIS
jgi:hypothetical protein